MNVNQSNNKRKSVILIDDNRMVLDFLIHFLEKQFEVTAYTSGSRALEEIESKTIIPDCIITDFHMPGEMTGMDIICNAKQINNEIPIVVLSGSTRVDDKIECLKSGAKDFVSKPFNPLELVARVDSVIRNNINLLRHAV